MASFHRVYARPLAVLAIALVILGVRAGRAEVRADTSRGAVEPAWEVLASPHRDERASSGRLAAVRSRAAQGQADAQHELGALLAIAWSNRQSQAEAAIWLERAARQGHGEAQFWLGNLYMRGIGVPRDFDRMAAWWRKAARQGSVNAQYSLGVLYRDGGLVPRDLKRSRAWFFMASGRNGGIVNQNEPGQMARRMLNRKPAIEEEAEEDAGPLMPVGFEDKGRNGR